jgi:hypothetical protein
MAAVIECNGSNKNGNVFSVPSRSLHFACSDSMAVFVRSGGNGQTEDEDDLLFIASKVTETKASEFVSAPSRSLHHLLRFRCRFLL